MIDQDDCKITIDYDFNYKHKDVPTVIVRLITAEEVKIVEIIQGKNIEGFLDLTSTLQDYGYKVVSQNRDRWIPVDDDLVTERRVMAYEAFNKGNDCDCCENQYLCGIDGDCVACHRADENKECNFVPVHCEFCDSFAREELKCKKLGYYAASNSGVE